ncbi:MAG: alcohol dehydrogenase catalytic domain-containing protein [Candidatus Omnitrophota bacterium]
MYYNNQDVRIQEMPLPEIGAQELLVKVMASGICGSDVMEWYRLKKAPLVLGHEISGEIVKVGKKVKKYKKGQRVFVSHHVPCNTCRYCLRGEHTVCETLRTTNFYPGGFAEFIRVPKRNVECGVFVLPGKMSYEEGTFIEPLACVLRGQRKADLKPGQSVLILGGGISGILHLLAAKASGAGRIFVTDINAYRLKAAKRFGAYKVIHAQEDVVSCLRQANQGRLADIVIVCTGALSAFQQAMHCLDRAGTLLLFASPQPGVALSFSANEFWRQGIRIVPSYGASPLDLKMAIKLLSYQKLPVSRMITHRLSLKQASLGFGLVAEGKKCLKVIIEPQRKSS